jgi:hypothetical protein
LKSLSLSKDRTVEFPLANFNDVLADAAIPAGIQKAASISAPISELGNAKGQQEEYVQPELTTGESYAYFVKAAAVAEQRLEDLQGYSSVLHHNLTKSAKLISNIDPKALNIALSQSCGSQEYFEKVATQLVVVNPTSNWSNLEYLDYANQVPTTKWNSEIGSFVSMTKEATMLLEEVSSLRKNLEKVAGIKAETLGRGLKVNLLPGAKGVARGAPKAGFKAKKIVAGQTNPTQIALPKNDLEKSAFIAGIIGRGIGAMARGVVKPLATAGTAAAKSVGNTIKGIGEHGYNTFAKSTPGKALGVPQVAETNFAKVKKTGGAALGIAGMSADAAFYEPKVDPLRNSSGDVWSALQGNH